MCKLVARKTANLSNNIWGKSEPKVRCQAKKKFFIEDCVPLERWTSSKNLDSRRHLSKEIASGDVPRTHFVFGAWEEIFWYRRALWRTRGQWKKWSGDFSCPQEQFKLAVVWLNRRWYSAKSPWPERAASRSPSDLRLSFRSSMVTFEFGPRPINLYLGGAFFDQQVATNVSYWDLIALLALAIPYCHGMKFAVGQEQGLKWVR